jgi:alginate O-acetyltransferase complex protein AlgI
MVFSSITFLVYFLPLFVLIYHFIAKEYKNWFILLASIYFFSWGAPTFVFVLVGVTILDFYLVKFLFESKTALRKRILLIASLTMNLGMLAYFKYANFFIENVNQFLHKQGFETIEWTKIALPIGISFFTFQSLTYAVDVYRNVHKPLEKLSNYMLFIAAFPQMIAGPIVRFSYIADQITERKETIDDKLQGFIRLCIGLGKKVLIANVMGEQAKLFMEIPVDQLTMASAWIGILAYTFQIYFDFAGYSDMAIGLGKIMGFTFPENFDSPYISRSITEFWRRWHITLGTWMRDYLYIPLGGNKVKTKMRLYMNLWFVFVISGLWHGASWNFVIWGAFHGFFLVIERLFLGKILSKIGMIPSMIYTFLVVVIGWVFFSIEKFDHAKAYIFKLFSFDMKGLPTMLPVFKVTIFIAILFSFIGVFKKAKDWENKIYFNANPSMTWYYSFLGISLLLFILSLSSIAAQGFNPFIYFRF